MTVIYSGPSTTSTSLTVTTVPQSPTIGTASDVGTGISWGNAQAVVTFTANATGGQTITGYTVTSSGSQTATGASSPLTVSGMSGGTNYSFTAVATNANGSSLASSSTSVTPTTVPGTPTSVTATAGVNQDTASWTAPDNGGSGITNYHVISTDGYNGDTATNSITIGDPAGNSLSYTVYATNANGNGVTSAASNSITTQAPFFPPSFFAPPFFPPGFFSPPGFFNPPGFFAPPSFFHPPGFCIEENTNVLTKDGYKKAKDIIVGDVLLTKTFDGIAGDVSLKDIAAWSIKELNNFGVLESEVTDIIIAPQNETIIINGDKGKRFSVLEEILVFSNGEYRLTNANRLTTADKLVAVNENELQLLEITSIETIEEITNVYEFNRKPFGLIVADSVIVNNGYPDSNIN